MSGPFDLYFLGGEQAGWRRMLADAGVDSLGISYWSLRKRRKNLDQVDIGSYGFKNVLLDSGGYSANTNPGQLTLGEWMTYGEEYAAFALANIDDVDLVTEFDCLALGPEWVSRMRREVWSQIDPEKFLPVWHPQMELHELERLGDNYRRIAISEKAVTGQGLNVTPHLNALVRKGVKLHGVAMTKPTVLRQVGFTTAASTSWLSPSQYGDTIVWVNNQLTRYPVKMKAQARLRHTALFEEHGFDAAKLQADDKNEVTKLAIWSWLEQQEAIRALRTNTEADRSNYADEEGGELNEATGEIGVGTKTPAVRNTDMARPALQQRHTDDIKELPMFGGREVEAFSQESNQVETIKLLEVRGTSARACNNCVLKDKCAEFKPDTTCAYSIPVEIKTKEQRAAFMGGMIQIQAQRVLFGVMVEQMNGGYPDPNLSQEYDRMLKALQVQADLEDNRDFLKISVEARGKTGVLSRLFDPQNAARAHPPVQQLDPQETDRAATRIVEGQRVT